MHIFKYHSVLMWIFPFVKLVIYAMFVKNLDIYK
nr:MAG TPA: hypothetical protein [Caudoviricetes sp.]